MPYGAAPYGTAPFGAYGSGPAAVPGAAVPGAVPSPATAVPVPPAKDKTPVEVPDDSVAQKISRKVSSRGTPAAKRKEIVHPDVDEQPRAAGVIVKAPSSSRVFVDGNEIKGRGMKRQYLTEEPLTPGAAQRVVVSVESTIDGRRVMQRELVQLKPGRLIELTFAIGQPSTEQKVAQVQ